MSHFALDFVPDYFSQDQAGGTKFLDIRRPGKVVTINRRRVPGPLLLIPGVIGNHHPVPGDDEVYEDQGSMRVGDELIFAKGCQLRAADEKAGVLGDQLFVQLPEIGTITVTDDADGGYDVTLLGITYPFTASSNTDEEIRDGLVAAIGSPSGLSIVALGTSQILVTGATKGVDLGVITNPASLTYIQSQFRNDIYEIWKSARWSYGQFTQYTARFMRAQRGV